MQTTQYPWYDSFGQCTYVTYFFLPKRKFLEDTSPYLSCGMCTIWEYQSLHKETLSRLLTCRVDIGVDYCWSGAMLTLSPAERGFIDKYQTYISNHGSFTKLRRESVNFQIIPEYALREAILSKDSLPLKKMWRKHWCRPPPGFEKAVNWLPFDSPFFKANMNWPNPAEWQYWKQFGTY